MTPVTVLLDIDGTLVDSNYHHALAWNRALRRGGLVVPLAEIHRSIGMGADQLLERFAPDRDDPFEEWWHDGFEPLIDELAPTPGAGDLVRHIAAQGATNVYATSGSEQDVDRLRAIIGADSVVARSVNSSEVDASKPAPDIFELAMKRVDADRERTIVLGDSVYDIHAASECGIGCVAVTCGGFGRGELIDAGALAVYDDPRDLHEHWAGSPIAALIDRSQD
ncbi:MAG: HAD family hydrolase [Ilumatobacter sp.]|uniref:HAD family hydrolase n=1 Tax=Ilumatobacter sp. TaxID=1967498 RepID=UPI0032968617